MEVVKQKHLTLKSSTPHGKGAGGPRVYKLDVSIQRRRKFLRCEDRFKLLHMAMQGTAEYSDLL
jgi:hypothetical protein